MASESGPATSTGHRIVRTVTTDIIPMTAHPTATTVRSGSMVDCLSEPAPGGAAVDTVTGAAVTVGAAAVTVTDEAATAEVAGVADVAAMDAVVTAAVVMDTATREAVEVVSMVEEAAASMAAVDTAEAASTAVVDSTAAATVVLDTAAATGNGLKAGSVSTAGSTALPACV